MATAAFVTADWKVGETRGPICDILQCEADGAIAQGDVVRTTGSTAAGILKAKTVTGAVNPMGVALYGAATGKMVEVLIRGVVRPKQASDGSVAAGSGVAIKAAKLTLSSTGSSSECFGMALTSGAADGDNVLIFCNAMTGGQGTA